MAVPETLQEINESLDILAPEYEGWQDFARLNLKPETQSKVQEIIGIYSRRISVLNHARVALENLDGDGYPELDTFDVAHDIFEDLKENNDTINAAFAKVTPLTASSLGLSSLIRPKTNP